MPRRSTAPKPLGAALARDGRSGRRGGTGPTGEPSGARTGRGEAPGSGSGQRLKLAPGQSPADLLAQVRGDATKRSKYGAKKTNGYDSAAESRYADKLRVLKQAGAIVDWLEQVPIKLAERITYRVDFMVIEKDRVRFVEVKGFETKEWLLKRKLLEEKRPEIFKRLEVVR